MLEIRISSPHEVVYVGGNKVPGLRGTCRAYNRGSRGFISISNLACILQVSGSCQDVRFVNADVYIEISPDAVKFATYIRRRMPAFIIIFTQLWIPLAHAVANTLGIITTASPDLDRNLCFKLQFKNSF